MPLTYRFAHKKRHKNTINPTTIRILLRFFFHQGWINSPSLSIGRHFVIDEILLYDIKVNRVSNNYASPPDGARHVAVEAVHDILQHIIRNAPDSRLVNELLYESSGCLYLL